MNNKVMAEKLIEAADCLENEAGKLRATAEALKIGKTHRLNEAVSSIIDLPRQAGICKIFLLMGEH